MTRRMAVVVLPLSLTLPTIAAGAAELGDADVGARIRVTAPSVSRQLFVTGTPRLVGTLVSRDEARLLVRIPSHRDLVAVPLPAVEKLQVSRRRGRKLWGTLIGFAVGTSIGLVASTQGSSLCDSTSLSGCDAAASLIFLGVPLAVVGALAAPGEKWQDLALPAPSPGGAVAPGFVVAPSRGGGATLAFSFGF